MKLTKKEKKQSISREQYQREFGRAFDRKDFTTLSYLKTLSIKSGVFVPRKKYL